MQANAAPDLLTEFETADAEDPREILYGHRTIIHQYIREDILGPIMLQKGRSPGIGQLCISYGGTRPEAKARDVKGPCERSPLFIAFDRDPIALHGESTLPRTKETQFITTFFRQAAP
jgi:hypothetical protein